MYTGRRVVITGLGPISPVGIGRESFWDSLVHGKTNFRKVTRYSTEKCVAQLGAEMDVHAPEKGDKIKPAPEGFKGLDITKYVHPKTIRKIARFGVEAGGWLLYYAIAAAKLAVEDANLNIDDEDPTRVGCTVAAAGGDMLLIRHSAPLFEVTQYGALGGVTGTISYEFGLQGVGIPLAGACASGSLSLRSGYTEIRTGEQDVVLVGGASSGLAAQQFFEACDQPKFGPMSKQNDEERPMKPFDVDRGGFVLGEGAGVMVLEELEHAKKRNAHIYAEIVGTGHSTDTATHMADVSIGGYLRSMAKMVENTGLSEKDLATKNIHLNCHGTATRKNDVLETQAIRQIFGDNAYKFHINSVKGTTGHAQEAASAHELIAAAMVLDQGLIPPTTGLVNPDPECGNLNFVTGEARQENVDIVIKNASGFCGPYCSVALKKFDE
ncbi:MAG: beta-ketoacyl-[acyl-carrier-protein] synthase family protein [Chloroflexota bacterium]